jgi:hypothetical protein
MAISGTWIGGTYHKSKAYVRAKFHAISPQTPTKQDQNSEPTKHRSTEAIDSHGTCSFKGSTFKLNGSINDHCHGWFETTGITGWFFLFWWEYSSQRRERFKVRSAMVLSSLLKTWASGATNKTTHMMDHIPILSKKIASHVGLVQATVVPRDLRHLRQMMALCIDRLRWDLVWAIWVTDNCSKNKEFNHWSMKMCKKKPPTLSKIKNISGHHDGCTVDVFSWLY